MTETTPLPASGHGEVAGLVEERDAIVAAGEELAAALARYGFPMSEEAWRNTGDDAPVANQASVEARALHNAAVSFFREVSGVRYVR